MSEKHLIQMYGRCKVKTQAEQHLQAIYHTSHTPITYFNQTVAVVNQSGSSTHPIVSLLYPYVLIACFFPTLHCRFEFPQKNVLHLSVGRHCLLSIQNCRPLRHEVFYCIMTLSASLFGGVLHACGMCLSFMCKVCLGSALGDPLHQGFY